MGELIMSLVVVEMSRKGGESLQQAGDSIPGIDVVRTRKKKKLKTAMPLTKETGIVV